MNLMESIGGNKITRVLGHYSNTMGTAGNSFLGIAMIGLLLKPDVSSYIGVR